MAKILDGRAMSQTILDKVKKRVSSLSSTPGLAVILVGNDPASHTYVAIKQKACEDVGIHFEKFLYQNNESEEVLLEKINELNKRKEIHGILVQLPLPAQNASTIIAAIDPKKDVDGFHKENIEKLKRGEPCIASAVGLGVMKLIASTDEKLSGKRATIVASKLFAEPIVALLKEQNISAHVCPEEHDDMQKHVKESDVVIVAEGHPGLITGEMIKPGAIIIDVGTTKIDGKLHGDVNHESVEPVAGYLTPVPGGVGPMTVAMLLINVLKAYQFQK